MNKILLLSDLHISSDFNEKHIKKISEYINDINLIFGLGDYTKQKALDNLFSFGKEVYAVHGNMDEPIISMNLPGQLTINIDGVNIGLIHGWGAPYGIRERIRKQFTNVQIICYGHTHSSYFKFENGIYFLNPGSLSGSSPSFGILKISNNFISADIINI